jgi:hypothetical protein
MMEIALTVVMFVCSNGMLVIKIHYVQDYLLIYLLVV